MVYYYEKEKKKNKKRAQGDACDWWCLERSCQWYALRVGNERLRCGCLRCGFVRCVVRALLSVCVVCVLALYCAFLANAAGGDVGKMKKKRLREPE